ncbi:hypothetical protein LEP1GSC195_3309 [Leptospira wolbachii serovar Codice str. CDC]|uniref:Uncharacterized protein n=1 Tax=Leptospira wolbachii serovar Codice str. CDC TaxID=1218599 RepID=R9A1I5_9LEPT|nr:hypothetical protein LEP1GSC195_3309 [Leptospira wolbachii serovar Codice str. CDC]
MDPGKDSRTCLRLKTLNLVSTDHFENRQTVRADLKIRN